MPSKSRRTRLAAATKSWFHETTASIPHSTRPATAGRFSIAHQDAAAGAMLGRRAINGSSPVGATPMNMRGCARHGRSDLHFASLQKMSHSYAHNLIHCVFSTKDRLNSIRRPEELWRYVAGLADARNIQWQEGYGAFSVSQSQRVTVSEYIANQAEHHCTRTFEQEFLALLSNSGIPYDSRFVFGCLCRAYGTRYIIQYLQCAKSEGAG
jgi:hypothetical protein